MLKPAGDGRLAFQESLKESTGNYEFLISGEKSGHGALSIRSDDLGPTRFDDSFEVRVIPTKTDLVEESSKWGVPAGALVFFAALYAGKDVQTFAPIAFSAGAMLGFIIFAFRYMTGLRPYR